MSAREYLKAVGAEYLLLLVATAALSFTVACGFKGSSSATATFALAVAVPAVLLAALFAIVYSKRTIAVGLPVLAGVLALGLVVAIAAGGGANVFDDSPDNVFLIVVVMAITAILSFCITRIPGGSVVFGVVGVFVCGFIEFMYEQFHVVAALLFIVAAIALVVYSNYRKGLKGTQAKKAAFGSATLVAAVAALAAVGISCAVFFVVVAPLNPPAAEVKLITEYKAYEELPRRGTNAELAVTNPDMTSALTNEDIDQANRDENQDRTKDVDIAPSDSDNPVIGSLENFSSALGYNIDSMQEQFHVFTFNLPWYGWIPIVLLVLALLAAPIVVKLLLRRRAYERAVQLPVRDYVEHMYEFFVDRFARMGIRRSGTATPYEYADSTEFDLQDFSNNSQQANFMYLTTVFVKARYGTEPLSEGELAAYHGFYESFYKNCRSYLGIPRYLRKFFRL